KLAATRHSTRPLWTIGHIQQVFAWNRLRRRPAFAHALWPSGVTSGGSSDGASRALTSPPAIVGGTPSRHQSERAYADRSCLCLEACSCCRLSCLPHTPRVRTVHTAALGHSVAVVLDARRNAGRSVRVTGAWYPGAGRGTSAARGRVLPASGS